VKTMGGLRWPDHVGGQAEQLGPDGAWVAWRLAAGNNRELGRSPAVFPDLTACRHAVARLQDEIGRVVSYTTIDRGTGLWAWRIHLDDRPVAVAARRYHRQRECRYSLAHFLAAVPRARSASTLLTMTTSAECARTGSAC
jgi:hypothetical protein